MLKTMIYILVGAQVITYAEIISWIMEIIDDKQ